MLLQFNKFLYALNSGLWVLLFDICPVSSPLTSVVAAVKDSFSAVEF